MQAKQKTLWGEKRSQDTELQSAMLYSMGTHRQVKQT
jgi:hypothetical protein